MSEDMSNIVELLDEDDNVVRFEHMATVEYEGGYYICMMPIDEEESDDEEGDIVIMKIEEDNEGNECYVTVDDEAVEEAVFEKFLALMDEDEADDEEEDEQE